MAKRCGHRRTEAQPGFCPVLFSRTPFLKKTGADFVATGWEREGKGGQSANAKLRLLTVRSGG